MRERDWDHFFEDTTRAYQILIQLEEFSTQHVHPPLADFARLVASRLNPDITPTGFVIVCVCTFHEVRDGLNYYYSEPLPLSLLGLPIQDYTDFLYNIPNFAEAAFSPEFAQGVYDRWSRLLKEQGLPLPETHFGETFQKP